MHERTKRGKPKKGSKLQSTQPPHIERTADSIKVLHHVYTSEATATKAARATWEKLQRGVAIQHHTGKANPELMQEVPVRVSGFKPVIDSTQWQAASVDHTIDEWRRVRNRGKAGNAD